MSFEERYKVIAILGEGTSGRVERCFDSHLNREVAIKRLKQHAVSPAELLSFQREAKTLTLLDHKAIVEVLDFGVDSDDSLYMVMEYFDGISLKSYIEEHGPIAAQTAFELFATIAEALDYAHRKGVLHRDLSPNNILISKDDEKLEARLIDFGVAAITATHARNETLPDGTLVKMVGSPLYMAPDLAAGRPYSKSCEIYSLGCVLYETLTGTPPFDGESSMATIYLHANEPFEPLSERCPDLEIPERADSIIERMLAKAPEGRFASMKDVEEALLDPYFERVATGNGESGLIAKERPPQSRRPALLAIGAVLATLCALAAAGMMTTIPHAPEESNSESQEKQPGDLGFSDKSARARTIEKLAKEHASDIILADSMVNDEDLVPLANDRFVKKLDLKDSVVTDAGLANIDGTRLQTLDLKNTGVSTLKEFSRFPRLEVLRLTGTPIKNSSLSNLLRCRALTELDVRETELDDGCIETIKNLPSLRLLSVAGSHISPAGVKAILKACPTLSVVTGLNIYIEGDAAREMRRQWRYEQKHDHPKTIAETQKVIDKIIKAKGPDSDTLVPFLLVRTVHLKLAERRDEAEKSAREMIRIIDLNNGESSYIRAFPTAASCSKDPEFVLACTRRYAEISKREFGAGSPEDIEAGFFHADTLIKAKQTEEAKEIFLFIRDQKRPARSRIPWALSSYKLAKLAKAEQDRKAFQKLLNEAISRSDPKQLDAEHRYPYYELLNTLCDTSARSGEREKALQYAQEVRSLAEKFGDESVVKKQDARIERLSK